MLVIEDFKIINRAENFIVTQHGRKRLAERGIMLTDVMNAISNGEIIEHYPDDRPFASALILGKTTDVRQLHVVASIDDGLIYLITAYFPDSTIWDLNMKNRKDV